MAIIILISLFLECIEIKYPESLANGRWPETWQSIRGSINSMGRYYRHKQRREKKGKERCNEKSDSNTDGGKKFDDNDEDSCGFGGALLVNEDTNDQYR